MKKAILLIMLMAGVGHASLVCDLDNSDNKGTVNLLDFAAFCNSWLEEGDELEADFTLDGVVDVLDLVYFSGYWLEKDVDKKSVIFSYIGNSQMVGDESIVIIPKFGMKADFPGQIRITVERLANKVIKTVGDDISYWDYWTQELEFLGCDQLRTCNGSPIYGGDKFNLQEQYNVYVNYYDPNSLPD